MSGLRRGGFLITKIHQLSGRIFARKLRAHGIHEINPAQGRILFVLWENDGIAIEQLAKRTQLSKSTLTSMLDRLEADGFLTREPSLEDRRKILIRRTEKDRALQQVYLEISAEMIALFYQGLSEAERDRFEADLERILANLEGAEE
jgi:DNA-binding MarR family transcriptional regulator